MYHNTDVISSWATWAQLPKSATTACIEKPRSLMQHSSLFVLLLIIRISQYQKVIKCISFSRNLFFLSLAMPSLLLPDWVMSQAAQLCQKGGSSVWVPKKKLLVCSQLYSHKMLSEQDTGGSWDLQLRIAIRYQNFVPKFLLISIFCLQVLF